MRKKTSLPDSGVFLLALFLLVPTSGCSTQIRNLRALLAASASTSPSSSVSAITWTFDATDSASYSYDATKLDFTGGVCRLTANDQLDSDGTAGGFGGATASGVAWDAANGYLRLSQTGTPTNLAELDSSWAPQWSNLQGLWHLNEAAAGTAPGGTDFADGSGKGNHGTALGMITYGATGKLQTAPSFSGTSTGITVPTSATLRPAAALSISMWAKLANPLASEQKLISTEETGGYAFETKPAANVGTSSCLADSVCYRIYVGGAFHDLSVKTSNLSTSQWYHWAGTYDGTTQKLYLNGVLVASAAVSGAITYTATVPLCLAADTDATTCSADFLNGNLDEVAVWNTALTGSEVQAIYSRQSPKYSGTAVSRVMDAFATGMNWTTLSWVPTLPFLKELPDYAGGVRNETSASYAALVGSTGSTGANDLMSGIVGLWHLDEPAGTSGASTVKDDSGQGNAGTPTAVTFGIGGPLATAAAFDGTSAYIDAGTSTALNLTSALTVSAWFMTNTAAPSAQQYVVSKTGASPAKYFALYQAPSGKLTGIIFDSSGNGQGSASTAAALSPGTWYHAVYSYDGTNAKLYLNGAIAATTAYVQSSPSSGSGNFQIGARTIVANSFFNGRIDEVAVWNRALHPAEIAQLYRRGANRIRHQVRVCTAADCSDDPNGANWRGPDGTNHSFFSELNNNTVPLDASGDVNLSLPSLSFASFTNPVGTSRYFQYRSILESDDAGSSCDYGAGATWCSPELKSVAVDPVHYDSSAPAVVGRVGIAYASLASLTQTLGTGCASGVTYNLGVGASSATAAWYWWDATANAGAGGWTTANGTAAKSNDAATITAHAADFGTTVGAGTVYFKAFLGSSGASACELDRLDLVGRD